MSPATALGLITGQFPSFKSNFTFFDFIIDMNNLNSNYGYPNSNETNSPALSGSRAPGGHVAASSASNLSRPRLMKTRKHTSYNPRFSDSRREEESDFSLRFNPFRSLSESIFCDSSSVNVPKKLFSFGAGSGNSNLGSESLIVDDLRKMQIDSDKSYTNVMVDQLPKGINKLNIGDSSNNVNTNKSQFTSTFRGNVEAELRHEMHKMNLGNNSNTFVFGRNSKSDESLISDKLGELKVGGDRDDNMKNFVFGSKTLNYGKQNKEEIVKDDLISDKMRELKVGGGGVELVFGQNVEPKVCESRSCSNVQPFGNAKFTSSPLKNVDFTFSSKLDNFGSPNVELKKKKKGKVRKPVIGQARTKQDFVFGQSSGQNSESFEAYSPMDVSPYQETLADIYSRGTSVTSDDDFTSQINDQNSVVSSESHIINSNITTDEELIGATQRLNVNDSDVKCEVSEAETFISAVENIEHSSDTFATAWDSDLSSTATSGKQEKTGTRLFKFGSKLENINKDNFTFTASTSSQGQHKKKHRLKTGQDSYSPTSDARNTDASSSPSSILSSRNTQKVDMSTLSSKNKDKFKPINGQDSKHGNLSTASVSIAAVEACEKWRLRGNQAYGNGDLAKAEDYYTQGLNSVSQTEKSKGCLRALMLCYSNRAATRISLGKMKEALKDCLMAAAIDPNFFKVQVRAAHCYLAIGEVEKASLQYMKCLQSGSEVCIDRKLLIEASKGLENSQKVTECFKQYTELPRRTPDELESTLRVIDEALQISSCSEQLLQMKADTLLMLRKFEQIIQMCEQTLSSAEISETPTSTSSWRSNLIVKSYFYLGRLEEANEFIKKQESSGLLTERLESMSLESVIPLADVIHELLSRKAAGNESYKLGKYAEAVEHYTSALSCSVESRPFAAICFCNRAAAYRSLGQISDAIADCSLAIALDPNYLKAISRRASLYEMIRDYGQAAKDLRKLVSLFTSQIEEKGIISGVSDKSSGVNELRQTQLQLYNIEEESRKEIPLNMYLILGVESTAAASEIKKAYRKAALKHHPDKAALSVSRSNNGDDGLWKEIAENVHKDADRLFKMIGEAYAVLSNPSKRSQYDMDEEMRNEDNKYTRSGSGRMAAEFHSPMYERSGSRRWQDNSWRSYVYSQSNGQEKYTSSYRYSKHS